MTIQTSDVLASERKRAAVRSVVPCALVYLDAAGAASPNCRSNDPASYVRQAVCLNKSLLREGMPRLHIYTNAVDEVMDALAATSANERPVVHALLVTRVDLPKSTPFYAAHFKLDLMSQVASTLPHDALLLLLDTDMVAMRELDEGLVERSARLGAGVFDISDQVFPVYGSARVIADLEAVAGCTLENPRWYGGEFLLCTPAFLSRLVACGKRCFVRYVAEISNLHHHGDEAFISAALSLLAQSGERLVDVGAYQAVGRLWPGNTHRNLYWFSRCAFLHLPGSKTLIEHEARHEAFDPARLWRAISIAHRIGQLRAWAKRLLARRLRLRFVVRTALGRVMRSKTLDA
ncbi:hypothetical protein [Trinickia fusca]|uniref:hypothetical protein n=1 Tax=Trinickia fusca TaxID=2419777 RepID=UPI0016011A6F|nr:hypothetical protein [Trinickia fusca]